MASFLNKIYREVDGKLIKGKSLVCFVHNGDTFFFTSVEIYEDGVIDAWGPCTLEEFEEKVKRGFFVTTLPQGAKASIFNLVEFKVGPKPNNLVKEEDFITEVRDVIAELNGEPTLPDKCWRAFLEYIAFPNEAGREKLLIVYEAVPEHLRYYLKAGEDITSIIYYRQESEEYLEQLRQFYL